MALSKLEAPCIASFVEPIGQNRRYVHLTSRVAAGEYMLLMRQGTPHGNDVAPQPTPANTIPIAIPDSSLWKVMSEEQLVDLFDFHVKNYGAVLVNVGTGEQRDKDVGLWEETLRFLGGSLPSGLPNSANTGIFRSNGIAFSDFAISLRGQACVRQAWHTMCLAVGRDSPWAHEARYGAAVLTSFDGVFASLKAHVDKKKFKGLDKHVDKYSDEPGQWQGLIYLHPPPPKFSRVGLAVAFYGQTPELRKNFLVALCTRSSTSPDLDSRATPLPNLGSGGATSQQRKVFGGSFSAMTVVRKFTEMELEAHARQLDQRLRALVPPNAKVVHTGVAAFLKAHGVEVIDLAGIKKLARADKRQGGTWKRELYVRAVASGMGKAEFEGVSPSIFPWKMRRDGRGMLCRAVEFGSYEKVTQWVSEGGQRNRKSQPVILQPSGRVTKGQKRQGGLKAFEPSKNR